MGRLERLIEDYAIKYTQDVIKVAPMDTGKLKSNIRYNLTKDEFGEVMGFEIDAFDYLEYLDKGVQGVKNLFSSPYAFTLKKPPIDAIEGWAKRKGINKWALQNHLYNQGIKPKRFLSKVDFEIPIDLIVEAYNDDIDGMFN